MKWPVHCPVYFLHRIEMDVDLPCDLGDVGEDRIAGVGHIIDGNGQDGIAVRSSFGFLFRG